MQGIEPALLSKLSTVLQKQIENIPTLSGKKESITERLLSDLEAWHDAIAQGAYLPKDRQARILFTVYRLIDENAGLRSKVDAFTSEMIRSAINKDMANLRY